MVLSITDIINGIDDYKEVYIKSIDDVIYLRPLSKGEWEKTNNIRQEALGNYTTNEKAKATSRNQRIANIESKLSFNIKESGDADFKAQVEAIYLSLDNKGYDKKTPREDIKKLPSDIFEEIYDEVRKLSGITDNDLESEVDDFPEDE